jgi:FKBP-type peptidyl-prolyl cis-trans isomerase FkpA
VKKITSSTLLLLVALMALATPKDTTTNYNLPDSVKAVQFLAELSVGDFEKKKHFKGGVSINSYSLYIDNYWKTKKITFATNNNSIRKVSGQNVYKDLKYGYFNFNHQWKTNTSYKLLISLASDSASAISIYSGYIFLPEENSWKLIGSYQENAYTPGLINPSSFCTKGRKHNTTYSINEVWMQRIRGSWKNLKDGNNISPTNILNINKDSVGQSLLEKQQIQDSIKTSQTIYKEKESVYYTVLKEGTGLQVNLTDTVTVHYKGYLFNDGSIFDQTKEKPATFPLNRLIKGWQIAVPECKVGGKVKIVIPSGLAYSIRTRAAKIPPNSILVFEVEVVSTNPTLK